MEYHSFIDSEGFFLGKTKYIKGEFISLPPEEIINDIRFINHKWICILPKVDNTEEGYIKFNLNLDKLDKLDNTLLQLEIFCKKNKIESEFIIKEEQFNKLDIGQQKQIIKSIISHGFKDIVFINGNTPIPQVKCRSFFTYNYNTKRREYNKIYFRKNVNYSFDCEINVSVNKGVDYNLLNDCLENIKKKHDDYCIEASITIEYIGCNAKCWYCCQEQSQKIPKLTTNDKDIIPTIRKVIKKMIELSKKENVKIGFTFLGGELTILDYDIQDEFVEIINNLVDKGYKTKIFSNGILEDAPLLHTKASYLIHVIDWKNKKLEKKNTSYVIIFTERDSVEDLENFKKLNKDVDFHISPNINNSYDFVKKNKKAIPYENKDRDKKHKYYLCRYAYVRTLNVLLNSSEHYDFYGCCSCRRFVAHDKIPTLLTTEMRCPKNCGNAYCNY